MMQGAIHSLKRPVLTFQNVLWAAVAFTILTRGIHYVRPRRWLGEFDAPLIVSCVEKIHQLSPLWLHIGSESDALGFKQHAHHDGKGRPGAKGEGGGSFRHLQTKSTAGETKYRKKNGGKKGRVVTLAIQASKERFWMLKHICRRWPSPISFAGYFNTKDTSSFDKIRNSCKNIKLTAYTRKSPDEVYPINTMRNLAIHAVDTKFFLLIDIDFWPDALLHSKVDFFSGALTELGIEGYTGLIVPAFRFVNMDDSCRYAEDCPAKFDQAVPLEFFQLTECVYHNYCRVFDYTHNPYGHSTTDYPLWFMQNKTELRRVVCFQSNKYEPYVVLQKIPNVTFYDESFTGYGKNKIQLIMDLRAKNFQFYVIPQSFVVHVPHRPSLSRKNWLSRDSHRKKMEDSIGVYVKSLASNKHLVTRLCSAFELRELVREYEDMWASSVHAARKKFVSMKKIGMKSKSKFKYQKNVMRLPPCSFAEIDKCY